MPPIQPGQYGPGVSSTVALGALARNPQVLQEHRRDGGYWADPQLFTPVAEEPAGTVYDRAGGGAAELTASGVDVVTVTDTGAARAVVAASGADAVIATESGAGVVAGVSAGSGAEDWVSAGAAVTAAAAEGTAAQDYVAEGVAVTEASVADVTTVDWVKTGGGEAPGTGSGPAVVPATPTVVPAWPWMGWWKPAPRPGPEPPEPQPAAVFIKRGGAHLAQHASGEATVVIGEWTRIEELLLLGVL